MFLLYDKEDDNDVPFDENPTYDDTDKTVSHEELPFDELCSNNNNAPRLSPLVISNRKTRRTRCSILLLLRMMTRTRTTMMPPKFPCLPIPAIPPVPILLLCRAYGRISITAILLETSILRLAYRLFVAATIGDDDPCHPPRCSKKEDDDSTITVHEEYHCQQQYQCEEEEEQSRFLLCGRDEMRCGKMDLITYPACDTA
jgi:hypothetical protein